MSTNPDVGGYRQRASIGVDGSVEVPDRPGWRVPVAELLGAEG